MRTTFWFFLDIRSRHRPKIYPGGRVVYSSIILIFMTMRMMAPEVFAIFIEGLCVGLFEVEREDQIV